MRELSGRKQLLIFKKEIDRWTRQRQGINKEKAPRITKQDKEDRGWEGRKMACVTAVSPKVGRERERERDEGPNKK
jgi:hypothetical protein